LKIAGPQAPSAKQPLPGRAKKTLFKMPAAQAKKQKFCFLKQTENVMFLLLRRKRSWA